MKLETSRDKDCVGNTKPKKASTQSNQLTKWCFTYNNYSETDILLIKTRLLEICKRFIFEREIGESGTPHLQGFIELKKAMRWTEFNLPDKIHWEKCNNAEASILYCQKDYQAGISKDIYFSGLMVKRPLKLINPNRKYQIEILDIIKNEPDERKIYWFFEKIGNVGKSQFTKYLVSKNNAIFIDEGKKTDLMNTCLSKYNEGHDMNLFVLDIPRGNKNNCSYKSIESIKCGLIYSPKYEGGQAIFNSPHIIIFSNYPPDIHNLSKDRWEIFEIQDDFSTKRLSTEEVEEYDVNY
jgi:hypothetical protein